MVSVKDVKLALPRKSPYIIEISGYVQYVPVFKCSLRRGQLGDCFQETVAGRVPPADFHYVQPESSAYVEFDD